MIINPEIYAVLFSATKESAHFLRATVPFIILGVVVAEFIVAMKLMDKFVFLARPITSFAHLSEECGVSFITAFVSPLSANSMLIAFYSNGIITKQEMFIASMMSSFPAIIMHWRAMLPVLIPLLGFTGLLYFLILVLVGLLKTLLVMTFGRILLKKIDANFTNRISEERPPVKEAVKICLITSKGTVKRILTMTIPTTFIVFILMGVGVFDILTSHLSGVTTYFPVPIAGLSIIAAQFANFVAAQTIAGNLLSTGVLTSKEIIITLLVGDVLSSISAMIRFLMPYYVGIFGPKIGMQILIIATAIRTGITLGVIYILASLW